ncbi:MAG: glycosyltransferase family 2 protein [Thermodesulfobacteriota bacterium]|nr:glycosyltransferase family 2 protein [Thermodesulfobacteriota bacterium]
MNRQQQDIQLSIIITVYSEEAALTETIERLFGDEKMDDKGYISEILLIVSPRSSEQCIARCHALSRRYEAVKTHIQQDNPGVGRAVREGFRLAQGNYIAIMSADLETEPEAVARMVGKIRETGCDVAVADRWQPGSGFTDYDRHKLLLNWLFQHLFRPFFASPVKDLTYGFKILRKEVTDTIAWEGTLHEIFIETTIKPITHGYRVQPVPTVWVGRKEGISRNTFFYNLRYVWLAVKAAVMRFKRPGQRE